MTAKGIMYSEHYTSPSSKRPNRGSGETGVTETCREARKDRGYVQGMLRADKWHRGYVSGTERDGDGEVQGMTGVERGF